MTTEELLQRQHAIIQEQGQIISDLLVLLNRQTHAARYVREPRKACNCGAGVEPLVRRPKTVNLCGCGKEITRRATSCVDCNAAAMRVVRLCACGNKRRADSDVCRACYLKTVVRNEPKVRHDLCACGARKRRESEVCRKCFNVSKARTKTLHPCACGVLIPLRAIKCPDCLEKNKALYTCACGAHKTRDAARCRACAQALRNKGQQDV